jgi:hypothetical protein
MAAFRMATAMVEQRRPEAEPFVALTYAAPPASQARMSLVAAGDRELKRGEDSLYG